MVQATAQRPAVQEMVVVHRMFRRELRLAPVLVQQVGAGDVARSSVVGGHLTELLTGLHHHHEGEDELLWPKLHERATLSGELVHRMEQQHAQVASVLSRVEALLPRWTAEAGADDRDALAPLFRELSTTLEEHLAEEEREILPLVSQHLTAEEWNQLGQRATGSTPKARLLVMFGYLLEDASPDERAMMLGVLPPPARLLYRAVGRRKYEKERDAVRAGVVVPQQRQG